MKEKMRSNFFTIFTIIYYIEGYIKSYVPFLKINKETKPKVIFPIIPKFSNNGDIFWFKKCIRKSYYAVELGYRIYVFEGIGDYSKK